MNVGPSDERRMIVDAVRAFVEREIHAHEATVERTREVPPDLAREIMRRTRELGFRAASLPEAVGRGGLSRLDFALPERELGPPSCAAIAARRRPTGRR